jgi:hypothetical protein
MNQTKYFFPILLAVWLALAGVLVLANAQRQPIVRAGDANDYAIFLPVLVKNTQDNVPPTPPPGNSGPNAFFVDDQYRSNSASIAVDAGGGMHVAYVYYQAANDNAPTYGVYLYCPADCTNFDNWGGVGMGDLVTEIQLELTANGKPRILYRSFGSENSNDFYYAACDGDCTNPISWQIAWVTMNQGTAILELHDDSLPQRYFALDPNGNPRFVYIDYNYQAEPDHLGTFYAYCNSACTQSASWQEVRISQDNGNPYNYRYEKFYYPSLTFTPQGQPRVVADGVSMHDDFALYYLACDSACGSTGSWTSLPLAERGSGPHASYDIEVDGQGRPRIAFYQGARLGGLGDRLSYLWCNNNCLNANNWQSKELGLGVNNGRGPDLELTASGLPQIAYAQYNVNGIGYSWCSANCESTSSVWQHQVVESGTELLAAWNVAFPPHCDAGFWDGLTPVLALDSAGNPYIAYDAAYHARCWYNPVTGTWDPHSYFHLIWRVARVNYFPRP